MSALGLLNFLVLQWFGIRLARVHVRAPMGHPDDGAPCGWTTLRWVLPLTGWWSPYRAIGKLVRW